MTSPVVVRLAIQTRYNICSFTAAASAEKGREENAIPLWAWVVQGERGENWSRHSGGGQLRMPFQECGAKNLLRAAGRKSGPESRWGNGCLKSSGLLSGL